MASAWDPILSEFGGFEYRFTDSPKHEEDAYSRGLALCKENRCGCYGLTWGCPPGAPGKDEVKEILSRYPEALVLFKKFQVSDMKDKEEFAIISKRFQDSIRSISLAARSAGIDNSPLGDGGCTFCEKCSYPEPCRFPDRKVVSVSAMGIDMETFLGSIGIEFEFRKDSITLYGIILFR